MSKTKIDKIINVVLDSEIGKGDLADLFLQIGKGLKVEDGIEKTFCHEEPNDIDMPDFMNSNLDAYGHYSKEWTEENMTVSEIKEEFGEYVGGLILSDLSK